MSKKTGYDRPRLKHHRYNCPEHKREYNFYQYENYLRHCKTHCCQVMQKDKGAPEKHRRVISFG